MVYFACIGIALVCCLVLWRFSLLSLPANGEKGGAKVALMSPLLGFLLFLSTLSYVPRWVQQAMHYLDTHAMTSFSPIELAAWPQFVAIIVAAVVLIGFSLIHSQEVQARIWAQKGGVKQAFVSCVKGMGYCLLCYPIVIALVQSIHQAMQSFGFSLAKQQAAIEQLSSLQSYPVLFWSMAACLVTLVPIIEELLFRGLLQNFFQAVVGARAACILASLFFALFHFTLEQGYTNVELLTGLFLYSFFMGVFYVRTASLWVPIGMHALFNALSILLMIYTTLVHHASFFSNFVR